MAYSAEISRRNPTAFLFVIDQSGSMNDRWQVGLTKAKAASDALNRLLNDLIVQCSKAEGIRRYFDVGVIGYKGTQPYDALGFIPGPLLKPIGDLDSQPLRIEDRDVKIPDGAGSFIVQSAKFPVWFEAVADGGTPMAEALEMAAHEIGSWCDTHRSAYPPTVLHITDAEVNAADPEPVADVLRQLSTDDGNVLLLNMHISGTGGARVIFPNSEAELPDDLAQRLFRMSSPMPDLLLGAAQSCGYNVVPGARGYGYNALFEDLVSFFRIGTQPANLAR